MVGDCPNFAQSSQQNATVPLSQTCFETRSSSTFELPGLIAVDESQVGEIAGCASRLRVLHVINGEHYSGAERVQDLLALNLVRFGFEVGFACLKPGRFASMRQAKQTPLIELRMKSRFDLRPAVRLARLLRKDRYCLVHTHTPRAALVGRVASLLAGVPLVHHVHSPTAHDSTRVVKDRFNAWIERWSLSGVRGVIPVSCGLADYIESQGVAPRSISVVPNGVPTRGPLSCRQEPGPAWTLGTVALFRPRKGLEVLLEALALLRARQVDVRFRAVGEFETAEYEQSIRRRAERLAIGEFIDWTGFKRDVPCELAQMDLFVLPSLFGEGLPMVILEAMACGVPIVATRVDGVPEVVRDGLEGLIARPGDPADLARAIAQYVQGEVDWSAIRLDAHRRQAEFFSDHSMARLVAQVYWRALAC